MNSKGGGASAILETNQKSNKIFFKINGLEEEHSTGQEWKRRKNQCLENFCKLCEGSLGPVSREARDRYGRFLAPRQPLTAPGAFLWTGYTQGLPS